MGNQKTVKKPAGVTTNSANQHLLNIITPSGIDVTENNTNVGDNYGRIYTIGKYPSEGTDYGWLSNLCNLEGTSTTVEYRYTDPDKMIDIFNNKIGELKAEKEIQKKESEKQLIDQQIKDITDMIHRIKISGEPVGYLNVMLHIQDTSERFLNNRIKRVSAKVAVEGCSLKLLKYKQLQALKCISPYGRPNRIVSNIGARNMPISTFVGGFPMANSGINDSGGYYLGKTKNGKLILLNQWQRNKDRTNSNWFISGLPGVGKSTTIKLIYVKEIGFGTTFIVFDPEREYVDFAKDKDVSGDIINCAGGDQGRINPLQIRTAPIVEEEDLNEDEDMSEYLEYDFSHGISDMALHIQNLRIFFKLYFGKENFSSGIKTALEECLVELYNKHHIFWDTDISRLKNEDFPILSDLYSLVKEKAGEKDLSSYKQNIYDCLSDLLYPIGAGADQFIWNGYTTINPKSQFIDLDTSSLLEVDDNVRDAQFFNLTSWAWQRMSQDRTEKVILGVDEGYLFVDPDNTDLMKFLRNISKRSRKYESGLMFITHSVVDLLDPAVKRFGQAIIDNSCYKFIMGCDGKNLEETKDLFHLTEREEMILSAKNRGEGILFAGSIRMVLKVEVREKFLKMFGSAGGR